VTDAKKQGLLPGKKYLFVLLPTKQCQLTFNELLLYSFLVYRAGTASPTVTQKRIAENLGLCKKTVRQSTATLEKLELAKKTNDGRWFAVEPTDKWAWFIVIKNINTAGWDWHKRFASFQLYLCRPKRMMTSGNDTSPEVQPQPGEGNGAGAEESQPRKGYLTPRENAVLWKIHSWNTGRMLMTVTHQGVATQLCLRREAVCRSIKALKAEGLLDDDLQATIKDEHLGYWRDAPDKVRRNPKAEVPQSLRELVLGWFPAKRQMIFFPDRKSLGERMEQYEQAMRNAGYNSADMVGYWQTTTFQYCKGSARHLECFMQSGFGMVFRVTEEIHAAKGQGYRNSLGLLRQKTEGVVRSIQQKDARRQFANYDPLLDWEPDYAAIRFGSSGRNGSAAMSR
jgi:hypothetical protein